MTAKRTLSGRFVSAVVFTAISVLVILIAAETSAGENKRPLMRFPDIHGDRIVFVCGEDIWIAGSSGGTACRLTVDDGTERYPRFSPDGKMLAFTGQYDGNSDVYVMDADGGGITRVTWHPGDDEVVGWHPVSGKILFSSQRSAFSRFSRLYLISPDGTGLEELIMHEAVQGSFSPDGSKIAYNRISRETRTWKRYRGGTAQELFLFDFEKNEDSRLTDFAGTDRLPMWIGDKIYFSSDRDRFLNIYSYDTQSGAIEQITRHKDYDVRRPSEGTGKIVYELGGDIWMLDTTTGKSGRVDISVKSDAPEARPYIKDVSGDVTSIACSPAGKRALLVARGEVFTVPAEHGPTRNLSDHSGARDKDAVWSPDGKKVAFFSDREGEFQVYLTDQNGNGTPVCLTKFKDGYRHTLRWSPDGTKLAFADQTLRCYYLDIASRRVTEVDRAEYENVDVSLDLKPIYDFSWSPDSRYIAYSKMIDEGLTQIYIYSLDTGKTESASDGIFNDFHPVFSKDGNYLFFVSNRRFTPTFCDFEWEMVFKDAAGIYCLSLKKDGPPLLALLSDEVKIEKEDSEKTVKDKEKKKGNDPVTIDFAGLSARIEHLPLPPGNYRELSANGDGLFYLNKDDGDFNRFEFRGIGRRDLFRFSFDAREEENVISDIDEYSLSLGGEKVIYRRGGETGIIDASSSGSKGKSIDLSGVRMLLDPAAEWKQIFNESWRMERDYYYEPNMHGVDWPAMKAKYSPLLDRAACRQDVRFVIGEMIGELNTSHTYVYGGDSRRTAETVNVGMLGVDWKVEKGSRYYRFDKVYRVADWTREIIPPLSVPGSQVADGEYLIEVDGGEVTTGTNIYSHFQGLAGKQVTLLVNGKPSRSGAREIKVVPLRGEYTARYLDWVESNRQTADRESGGLIGYIHLPDTYTGSTREFPKYFYSQSRKKGIIVDGRFNAGGLDPAIFYQRLTKKAHSYWTRRYSHDQTDPAYAQDAHLVCLTNKQAGSGGDMVPMEFQIMRLGPVIGTRTWGGLVGVSMFHRLIDGGGLTIPDYRIYDREGKWIVENEGVTPDIEVDLDPVEVSEGHDAQLMKAIDVLMKMIEDDPRPWPEHGPFKIDQ
ncbi:MAG: PD40 domain-containing protein [Candidatus Krumholzibacteriota bacterium]|nr:PD40 domain-containing protein [Candidatus Krumholzibacteriota bacterium]